MGIWDIIKELFGNEAGEGKEGKAEGDEAAGERRKISIGALKVKIDEMLKEDLDRKEWLRKTFIEKIEGFEREAEGVLRILKSYDLNKRKDQERLKLIVADNYYLYCSNVDRLLKEIERAKELELNELMKGLSLSLKEFSEHSAKPYEKATILIGQEMANVRNAINNFIREMEGMEKENAVFFEKTAVAEKINEMILEIEQNDKHCWEIESAIEKIKEENEKINSTIGEKERKIEEIKNSEDYKKDLEIREGRKKEAEELEDRFRRIKERVDIKLLGKHFHFEEKKNELVKKYANNFRKAFENDENLEIIEFVKSSQGIDISELKEIREKLKELDSSLITESEKKIFGIEKELEKIKLEISYEKSKIDAEMKRKEKIINKKKEIIGRIDEHAGKLLNVGVEKEEDLI